MFENRVLRRIAGSERQKVLDNGWRNYMMRSFITWVVHQISGR
jgi:hypothetical protein